MRDSWDDCRQHGKDRQRKSRKRIRDSVGEEKMEDKISV